MVINMDRKAKVWHAAISEDPREVRSACSAVADKHVRPCHWPICGSQGRGYHWPEI